jgi:N-acetylmuramoyl-L-alanine amidase
LSDDFFAPEGRELTRLERRRGEKRGHDRMRNILLIVGACVIAAGLVVGLVILVTRGEGSGVPKVIGMTYSDARKKAASAGLEIKVSELQDTSDNNDLEKLKVEEQDPKPGSNLDEEVALTVKLAGLRDAPPLDYQNEVKKSSPGPGQGSSSQPAPAAQPAITSPTPAAQSQSGGKTVCIDPGHSPNPPSTQIDPETGLDVADNSGASGEIQAMWDLSSKVKAQLEAAGYRVTLTKQSANSNVSLKERAQIGNTCNIVVRLHYDPALQALIYPGEGEYKKHGSAIVYVDPNVAKASAVLAQAMFPYLKNAGIPKMMNDAVGTSNNEGPAYVGSVLSKVPVVLIENNPSVVTTAAGQDRMATAITQGVQEYFKTH